jgi:large subunit ribosomal protein L22e
MVSQAANKGPKAKTVSKFIIDASKPAKDKIFDSTAFVQFLQERIKVDGRTGNLGDKVTVEDKGDGRIEVVATNLDFSGRYLKYLTKKFLKKNQLRDWLRVVSTAKRTYTLKFFNVVNEADEADEDEE